MKKQLKLLKMLSKSIDLEDFYSIELRRDEVRLQGDRTPEMLLKYGKLGYCEVSEFNQDITNIRGIGYVITLIVRSLC
jgi:hypothetical protein